MVYILARFLYRILCGFFLGVSVFAPGFSGSIIAIVMGVYQDLLRIISNPFKDFKRNVIYCVPLAIGAAISAVLFILTFKRLFDAYEKATYLLFVGLIAGNIPIIFAEVKKCGFQKRYLVGGIAAFTAALVFGVYAMSGENSSSASGLTANWLILGLGGFVGGATALIPGMSVTTVLILMGLYSQLIYAADTLLHFETTYLIRFGFFGVCAVAGLVVASRVIKTVFGKYPGFSNATVLGFMSGSLVSILVKGIRIGEPGFNWLLGGGMLAAGLAVSMLFVVLGKRMNKDEALKEH